MVSVPAGAACIFQCGRDCTGGMSAEVGKLDVISLQGDGRTGHVVLTR